MRHAARFGSLIGALVLAACTVGPDYQPPQITLPAQFDGPIPAADAAIDPGAWWQSFKDPLLDKLVAQAIEGNLSLKIAAQRIAAARAERDAVAAAQQPTVGAGVSAANSRSSELLTWPPGLGEYKTYQFGLEGSWEIDLFGGTRRAVEAADAQAEASVEDRRAAVVAVLGELAADYAILRSNQHRLDIAHRNIAAESDAWGLSRRAFAAGLGTEVDMARAEAAVHLSEAQLPTLEAGVARMTHAIAVLLGRFPEEVKAALFASGDHQLAMPPLPAALPSEVLRNRPDIRRAERRIAAATARVGVATAELFPKLKIPLGISPMASNLGNLLNAKSLVWTFGASASQTLLDGGRDDARIRAAEAVAEEDRLAYRQTVLTAFGEIEDRLIDFSAEQRRHVALTAAVEEERRAFDRITRLYAAGLTDFLGVLDSARALFHAEDSLAQSDLNQTLDLVGLYRALGGGWRSVEDGAN
jgi:NodT family efflux transporter outer membrane factor (OMF) lipoprotein